ncbi:NAD(P)/FAD-dependent oxidoreductase [Aureispira anguillae]|uniref:NAD(P)/FAD-dependent oxidoreductase n=1 Tax=Aureispira anguillae TaxID=2864201 RepID=A0A916DP42_9BACT|nr:NAD(P)/FAD-dependent oxidoreductase [Aureispira anguillae]BDS09936.1 NAD(P)/FAD-dependent oxidoreductase [Aureispira anguillae]
MNSYQIAIIGGGPAGSSCALALARLGIKEVVIIESGAHDQFKIGESIPPESKTILRHLGIWNAFKAEKHDPCYGSCSYWGDNKRGYNDFLLSPYGHGWHLDRSRFDRFLFREAQKAGTHCLLNTQYKRASKLTTGGFELVLQDSNSKEQIIQAQLVVDATGSRSLFALQQGSKKIHTEPLICLAARFEFDPIHTPISKLTQIEASEYGWWYAARLPQHQFLVGLYTDAITIKQRKLQQVETWQKLLDQLPVISQSTRKMQLKKETFKGFPAPSFCLDKMVGRHWIAIGDAATAYDPITSQGIMKSMSNGIAAAQTLQQKITQPKSRFINFQSITKERYKQYLAMRQHFYQLEKRWPQAPFWAKYQQTVALNNT